MTTRTATGGRRVLLRRPRSADREEFLALVRGSRALHRPWVSPPATPVQYRDYLRRMAAADHAAFLVCIPRSGRIAGVINMSHIVRGAFCSAYLGYYAFAGCEGRGYMLGGLRAVVRHAFGPLRLHRLEANIQPGNAPSIALARAAGFRLEGYSPRYLKIGGRWRDHERWAILAS